MPVRVRRVKACSGCGQNPTAPLFTRKSSTAPELRYLNAKLAALMPFGKVADFLNEVLPDTAATNAVTVRNRTPHNPERAEEKAISIIFGPYGIGVSC